MTPENKKILKDNFTIVFLFLAIFALPFVTSLLLDLLIIQKYTVRIYLVYVLMLAEFLLLSKLFYSEIKN